MKGALFWVASTALAFAITAGVFLMLAEFGTDPPERSLSAGGARPDEPSAPLLSIDLPRNELESLEEAEDQALGMTLSNGSDRRLTDINVYLILSSEDTADQETRYYEAEIEELGPQESKRVRFDLDLSPPEPEGEPGDNSQEEESFSILEVRAASSEGASTVKTAVLSL